MPGHVGLKRKRCGHSASIRDAHVDARHALVLVCVAHHHYVVRGPTEADPIRSGVAATHALSLAVRQRAWTERASRSAVFHYGR